MSHRTHVDRKLFACGLNEFPVTDRHGLGKGPGHNPYHASKFPGPEFYRVNFYARIGRIHEHRPEVFDMLLYAVRAMTVGPIDNNIL